MTTSKAMRGLVRDLERIVGAEYVLHRPEDLLVYEYDGAMDRALPSLVVLPGSAEEVAGVVRTARRYGVPLVPRGAGTGLSGGAIAVKGGILLALARLRRILEVDPVNLLAVVEPGVVNLHVSRAVAPHGLYYAPDPSSQKACTIGGNIAENSGGPHCLAYGVTTNHVLGLEVVLADGSLVWLGGKGREPVGYDLRGVVIGSEGTLCIVTKIVLRLLPQPEAVKTFLAAFPREEQATTAVSSIIGRGIVPAAVELMDQISTQVVEDALHAGYPRDAGAILLVEVDGLRETVQEEAQEVETICYECGAVEVRSAETVEERERLWMGRKAVLGALGRLASGYYLLDGVVPRTRLTEAFQAIRAVSQKYGLPIANVAHAGDGNLHPCILYDERSEEEAERARKAGGEILKVCVDLGGVLSGEHGIGLEKRAYMPLLFTPQDLEAMARLKTAFRTDDLFNPSKVFPEEGPEPGLSHRRTAARLGPDAFI